MKSKLLAIIAIIALASCGPAPVVWQDTPNPLDFPAGPAAKPPESMGVAGPHSEFYR